MLIDWVSNTQSAYAILYMRLYYKIVVVVVNNKIVIEIILQKLCFIAKVQL